MPMPDECLPLIVTIRKNINIAQTLIEDLKKYIDVTDHLALIKKLSERFKLLVNIDDVATVDNIISLVSLNIDVETVYGELKYSLHTLRLNYHYVDCLRGRSPEAVDNLIKETHVAVLSKYTCHQGKLIENMLNFCNTATNSGSKTFYFFNEDDIECKWREMRDVRRGVCFGLGSLFLLCSFVDDMQQKKIANAPQDDLRWFYRCIILLQLEHYQYSVTQQQDITRFISLVIHFQNNKMLCGIQPGVFAMHQPPSFIQQCTNFYNAEFSGDNSIEYFKCSIHDKEFTELLLSRYSPLYIHFALHHAPNSGHTVSLHKSNCGVLTFYDSGVGITNPVMNSEADYLAFKSKYLFTKEDTVTVIVGRPQCKATSLANAKNDVVGVRKRMRLV